MSLISNDEEIEGTSSSSPFPQSVQPAEEFTEFAKIIFPDKDPSQVKFGPDELAYLSRLGTQGLESLVGEVARVTEELAIIEHQTRDMASQNYQIFVQSAQTANLIKKSLSEAKQSVENLSSKTFPSIKTHTETFLSDSGPSNEFVKSQGGVKTLFDKEQDLVQILDMPWVVRRCLANSDNDKLLPEAIKILHVVTDYKKSVGDDEEKVPPVLAATMSSVLDLQSQIQSALLLKLQSPSIGLSDCLQTVQLLRNFFPSDKSLRFRFLQSRMNKEIEFENSRSWIFDTLTQHRAAFGQDSNHYLSTFIALQLTRVLSDLKKHIDHQQNLDSLFRNASYFGESLARVGADMRGLLVPIFSEFIIKKAAHDLLQAEMTFSKNLHSLNLSTCMLNPEVDSASETFELPNDLTPPGQLLSFHPLAVYCNEILVLLNFVGKCPLLQVCVEISRKLNTSLGKVGNELEGWGESEWLTWESKEQNLFKRMQKIFEHLLVPHIDKVYRVIFSPNNFASISGINVAKCAEIIQIAYKKPVKKEG